MANAGKQLLADRADELGASLADEFSQGARLNLFLWIQILEGSSQGQRPDGRIDKDKHRQGRDLRRSAL